MKKEKRYKLEERGFLRLLLSGVPTTSDLVRHDLGKEK